MKLSDLKPRIKRVGGQWRCQDWECFGVGLTPTVALRNWQAGKRIAEMKRLFDKGQRQLPQLPEFNPLLPRYVEPPRQPRPYWWDYPPGTIFCGSPPH